MISLIYIDTNNSSKGGINSSGSGKRAPVYTGALLAAVIPASSSECPIGRLYVWEGVL